jgi:hypothetical protein
MGDYEHAKRTTKTHVAHEASQHHKPLPKGSDGSKPVARAPGQRPKPKRSGVMFQAHQARAQSDAPKFAGAAHPEMSARQMNPTYVDASHYVETYFRRQGEVASLLDQAARDGFEAFKTRTSSEYNRSSSLAMALFELALNAIPAASGILGFLKELTSGQKRTALLMKIIDSGGDALRTDDMIKRLHKAAELVEGAAKGTEEVKLVKEGVEKAVGPHETAEARNAAQEKGNFQIETIQDLTRISAVSMKDRFDRETVATGVLALLEFSDSSIDLKKIAASLGELPAAPSVEDVKKVSDAFEINLYFDWYVASGKTSHVMVSRHGNVVSDEFRGMPDAVVDRFRTLHKMDLLLDALPPEQVDDTQWTGHMQ